MSKKAFILFILCILSLFGGLYWYLFGSKSSNTGDGGVDTSSELFPFGPGSTSTTSPRNEASSEEDLTIDLTGDGALSPEKRLVQISTVPTAGARIFTVGSSTIVRYIERATGHIYDFEKDSVKLSNLTIPKITEALWNTDGSKLLIRYLREDGKTIRTFYAKIATTTRPERALEGIFLPDAIDTVSIFGDSMFYMTQSESGAQGIRSALDGSNKNLVFSSDFGNWIALWTGTTTITLQSKSSGLSLGVAYTLNPQTGTYTKTVGDVSGLTALTNSDGSLVFASKGSQNNLSSAIYTAKTGELKPLGVNTLADKCVWSTRSKNTIYCAVPRILPSALYPDDWYKGKITFTDSLWKIDVVTGETLELLVPEFEGAGPFDMIKIQLDQKENSLIFTNKSDMTVWRYNLVY